MFATSKKLSSLYSCADLFLNAGPLLNINIFSFFLSLDLDHISYFCHQKEPCM